MEPFSFLHILGSRLTSPKESTTLSTDGSESLSGILAEENVHRLNRHKLRWDQQV